MGLGAWMGGSWCIVTRYGRLRWGCGKTQKHSKWRGAANGPILPPPHTFRGESAFTPFLYSGEVARVTLQNSVYLCALGGVLAYLVRDYTKFIQDKVTQSLLSANENTLKE